MINYAIDRNVALLSWNMSSVPMNVLNDDSIPALESALQRAYADPEVQGIIITSDRNEFIAGADLKMILRSNEDPEGIRKVSMELNRVYRTLETWGKPVVAAINGTALGGGYELCLACHYRIALDTPKAVIGLPEVTLGLLPGGGGTQRLPRLLGIEAALPLMLEGKRLGPKEAKALGLVDELAVTREELLEKARCWITENPRPLQPWDERDAITDRIVGKENNVVPGESAPDSARDALFEKFRMGVLQKTHGNYPAPLEILSSVAEGFPVNIDRALEIEAEHFVRVGTSREAKNLIQTMFLGLNEVNKGSGRPKDIPVTTIKKVGILGAGMMGSGIAYVSAAAGIGVVLKDITDEAAERGKNYSRQLLKKAVERGTMQEAAAEAVLETIHPTSTADDLRDCELIVEAVFEDPVLKAQVTREAEPFLAENGVFASNTSTLPISGLAEASRKPENFIGLHFFSPVDKMQLVEIILGRHTSDYALATAIDYVRRLRKTPIVVNDSRGFYTTRVFISYTSEGMELLKDGVSPDEIETAGRKAGMPVGPLAVMDEISLELVYHIAGQGVEAGALPETDTSYRIGRQFVELGRPGKKGKAGFYEYPEDGKKYLWPGLQTLFPLNDTPPPAEDVRKRLLYRQALEAVRCLEEGVVRTKLDADLGSILGWGFPSYTGGTLSFVEFVGLSVFVTECDRLAEAYGERFRPTDRLRQMAATGEGFREINQSTTTPFV